MYSSALFTDLYEMTMIQGYFLHRKNPAVVFDMFFRKPPFNSGYSIFAGLGDLLSRLVNLRFGEEELSYLEKLGTFKPEFLSFLENFKFSGDLYAMDEGSIVFPGEPLVRIHSSLIEAQLIEGLLLNIINFQTLIATKAARIYSASEHGTILEFGLRRAQGIDGALSAARAAYIGGASATSNTYAGMKFDIPVSGTMAHSWVMAFETELESFQKYYELYPDNVVLLIDTYDTLGSGIENAITIGLELKKQGKRLGVRLDSGDLQYLSSRVRKRLDDAGLNDAFIAVSNELNEEIIRQLVTNKAPIDVWGVGTQLVTGGNDAALSGVYKLCAKQENGSLVPTLKVSDNPEKTTNPGIKQVYRFSDSTSGPQADLIALEDEIIDGSRSYQLFHPMYEFKHCTLSVYDKVEPLLSKKIDRGMRIEEEKPLSEIRDKALTELGRLDDTFKRIINPHIYKVSLTRKLRDLKFRILNEHST